MKKIIITSALLTGIVTMAQETKGKVGINTDKPQATLEIKPNAANAADGAKTNEGVIAPKLSKTRVANIATDKLVEGTLVYVTDETTNPISAYKGNDAKVAKITEKGYYFYNGKEWVKSGVGANDQLWVQRDNSGITETYLKPAEKNGDLVGYESNRKFLVNLGTTTATDFNYNSITNPSMTGYAKGQVPYVVNVTSDVLPEKAELGGNNSFFFSKLQSIVRQDHLGKHSDNLNAIYRGHELTLVAKDVTSNMKSMVGTTTSVSLTSNNSLETILGGQFITSAGSENGTYKPSVVNNIGARIFPRNYGTSTTLRGVEIYPMNYGTAKNVVGALFSTGSRYENENAPSHTLQALRGIDNRVYLRDNATMQGSVYGVRNEVHIGNNTDLGNYELRGIENAISMKSVVNSGTVIGKMSALMTAATTIGNYEAFANYAALNSNTAIENYEGYRFSSPTIEVGSSVKNLYGVRMYTVNKGTESNYGLYVGDVSGGSSINHAIHTEAGKIRFGDLKGTGKRPVFVNVDGVLVAGDAATTAAAFKWVEDAGTNSVKLAVTSAGGERTTNPVYITDAGQVYGSTFRGSNSASIFPDYVFQKYYTGTSNIKADYNFKTLSQVEDFVKTNGHLPGYKSAEAIKSQGFVDLMETQLTNVEKIEELYLHSIEQEKKLKQVNEELVKKNQELEARLEKLEKLLK